MWFDNFDNKIREAADHHRPVYHNQAWNRMKDLLDLHMPEENKKRKGFLIWMLLILLLGGGVWYLNYLKKSPQKEIAKGNQRTGEIVPASATPFSGNNVETDGIIRNSDPVSRLKTRPVEKNVAGPGNLLSKSNRKSSTPPAIFKSGINPDPYHFQEDPWIAPVREENLVENKIPDQPLATPERATEPSSIIAGANDLNSRSGHNLRVMSSEETKKTEPFTKANSETKRKTSKRKTNSFFFSLSGGPDITFLGTHGPGELMFVKGGGIGLNYRERFTLRTGFYTARKLYSAQPDDYHPPVAFYDYYPNFQKVDADCKVYEIPVTLSYNFGKSKTTKWFVSTGLSTYLMKRETYDFYYKWTSTGPTINRERTVYDRNDHYFSVLNLSGGIKRKLGKTFSVAVEPYLKIPVTGIGFGMVKLNSGGVLFSVMASPFHKKSTK